MAFFADIHEPDIGRREEGMLVVTPADERRLAELAAAVTRARQRHVDSVAELPRAARRLSEGEPVIPTVIEPGTAH